MDLEENEIHIWNICKNCLYRQECSMSGYIKTKNFDESGCENYIYTYSMPY